MRTSFTSTDGHGDDVGEAFAAVLARGTSYGIAAGALRARAEREPRVAASAATHADLATRALEMYV
jgi:hypothetical protein